MAGALALMLGGLRKAPANITVTCGAFDTGQPPPDDGTAVGYSVLQGIGSRSPTGYSDSAQVSRTVTECVVYAGSAITTHFIFGLDGTSVPNNDQTFRELVVNGTVLSRAAASYDSSENGDTWWTWDSGVPSVPGSGDITLTVRF